MSQIKQCEAQRGSRIEDQGLRFEDRGSRIEDRGSRTEDWGSRIEAFSAAVLQVSLCKALQARLAHLGCVALRAVHWPSLLLCCHFLPGAASATTGSCPQTTTSDTPLTPPPPCAGEKQNNAASVIADYFGQAIWRCTGPTHIDNWTQTTTPTPTNSCTQSWEANWNRWILMDSQVEAAWKCIWRHKLTSTATGQLSFFPDCTYRHHPPNTTWTIIWWQSVKNSQLGMRRK